MSKLSLWKTFQLSPLQESSCSLYVCVHFLPTVFCFSFLLVHPCLTEHIGEGQCDTSMEHIPTRFRVLCYLIIHPGHLLVVFSLFLFFLFVCGVMIS